MTTATLPATGRQMLGQHEQFMTSYMTSHFGVGPDEASHRVTRLWDRWVKRWDNPAYEAEDALTAAIQFFAGTGHILGSDHPDCKIGPCDKGGHSPDKIADAGWHFMLQHDTEAYAALTTAISGRRIEHRPNDMGGCKDDCISGGDD